MQSKYSINIMPKATNDLELTFEYISNELKNPCAAIKLIDEMQVAIESLSDFPFSGAKTNNPAVKDKNIRKLVVKNYIIFYLPIEENKEIKVLRVLYGMTSWITIL